jgi:DNA-binding transcriptional LysR family regulator
MRKFDIFYERHLKRACLPMRAIDPVLLQSFVAVVEAQSFARAAQRLNKTQPVISTHIRRLEDLLSEPLIVRGSGRRHLGLTRAGHGLLPLANQILRLQADVWKTLKSGEVAGTVRLGVTEDHAAGIIPRLVGQFRGIHPKVDIDVQTGMTLRMRHEVGTSFDIVLAAQAPGSADGEVLHEDRLVWLSKNGRASWKGGPIPLAIYPDGCLYRRWAIEALDRIQLPWRVAISSPSRSAILAVVTEGFGVSVLPISSVTPDLRRSVITKGLPVLPKLELALYRAPDRRPAAHALADFLIRELPKRLEKGQPRSR